MNVENISISDSSFKTKKGIVPAKNTNVSLKNISLNQGGINLVEFNNVKKVKLENVTGNYKHKYITISGSQSEDVTVESVQPLNSDQTEVKNVKTGVLKLIKQN
jgi:hypothetical protein